MNSCYYGNSMGLLGYWIQFFVIIYLWFILNFFIFVNIQSFTYFLDLISFVSIDTKDRI